MLKSPSVLLLSCALVTSGALSAREVSIRDFSEAVRTSVITQVVETLRTHEKSGAEISGTVTSLGDGCFFLQNGDTGLKVDSGSLKSLPKPGETVRVSGVPSLEGGRVILQAVGLTRTGSAPLPLPCEVSSEDLLNADVTGSSVNWRRISLVGRAIGATETGFAVDVSGIPVNVICRDLPDYLSNCANTHPKVRVTGVVELILDQSAFFGNATFIMGVKLTAGAEDMTLLPDLAYLAACRSRRFVIGTAVLIVALCALLVVVVVLAFRQRRRLFRSRTLMAERKRMADDLHDTIEQHLVGAGMLVKLNRLKEAEGVLVRAKREIRDIVWGLKNDDMMRLSPAEMLRQLAHDENIKGLCRVDTKLAGLPEQMDAAQMRDLSLIVREAIGNAIKHGGAKKVAITADPRERDGWLLRVANNGRPFDPAQVPGAAEGHFGLEGMRQRACRLGATLSFSQRAEWTVLSLLKQ